MEIKKVFFISLKQDKLRRFLLSCLLSRFHYPTKWIAAERYEPSNRSHERFIKSGIMPYVKGNPALSPGVLGAWLSHWKALEHITFDDGVSVILEDDFACRDLFFEKALKMINNFGQDFDVIMFDMAGEGPHLKHQLSPGVFATSGATFPDYFGAHCLFVNNRSVKKILRSMSKTKAHDPDGFYLMKMNGLSNYAFYTGISTTFFWGSHTRSVRVSLKDKLTRIFEWFRYVYTPLHFSIPFVTQKRTMTTSPLSLDNHKSRKMGFWRRLERSIRKRRKRFLPWIDSLRELFYQEYPDFSAAMLDPFMHYTQVDSFAKRKTKVDIDEIKTGTNKPPQALLRYKNLFDKKFYLRNYPDVKKAGLDPLLHFKRFGYFEKRFPYKPFFSINKKLVSLSVVIPSHNGYKKLLKTLRAIRAQSRKDDIEVIVVDDGSDSEHKIGLENLCKKYKEVKLLYLKKNHGNPCVARNRGVTEASKEVVHFLGDDISPQGLEFFRIHWRLHQQHNQSSFAVLGKVEWPKEKGFPISPVMRHIQGPLGEQFAFSSFFPYQFLEWDKFYTCNVSIKRCMVGDWNTGGFDKSFVSYGFEDGELAYRMKKFYGRFDIFYAPDSLGYHYHVHNLQSFIKRQQCCGSQLNVIITLHPELSNSFEAGDIIDRLARNRSKNQLETERYLFIANKLIAFAQDLETKGILGKSLWHKTLLHAVFRMSFLIGFINARCRIDQDSSSVLSWVLSTTFDPLRHYIPNSLKLL
jgi:glycosyltransferase involved in cell wall biosynthesis/GR25 family glycosyltransferase involved in LPS biosynthesis